MGMPTDENLDPPEKHLDPSENEDDLQPAEGDHASIEDLIDTEVDKEVLENITENGKREITGAAARKLQRALYDLKKRLKDLDLDTLEMLGLDAESFRDAEEDIDWVLATMREFGEQVLQKAAAMEEKAQAAKPMWAVEVGSFSDPDTRYTVRWDKSHYEEEHADDGEAVHEPHYSCTCKAFLFGSHDGKYCKHIDAVIRDHGDGGEMPSHAIQIGKYADTTPNT